MLDGRVRPPDPEGDPWRDMPAGAPTEAAEPTLSAADAPVVAPPPTTEPPAFARAVSNDLRTAWSKLDRMARYLAIASAAAILISLVGVPAGAWPGLFAFVILVACLVTFVTAFLGATPAAKSWTIPLGTIEFWATHVVAVLALLRAIQAAFDLGRLADTGGVVAVVFVIGLVVAAGAMIFAFNQRGSDPYAALRSADQGTRIAAAGLGLVLLGWAYNLSLSWWEVGQAALPVAVLTLAALVILEAPRVRLAVPTAWVGAGIGAFGALLLLWNWSALLAIGRTRLELDPPDVVGFLVYTVGTVLVIVGGYLSGRDALSPRSGVTGPPTTGPTTPA